MPSTRRALVTAALAAACLTGGAAPPAMAEPAAVSDRYVMRAGSRTAEMSLFGRRATFGAAVAESDLEAVSGRLSATATALPSTLTPQRAVARFGGDTTAETCETPPMAAVLTQAAQSLPPSPGRLVPGISIEPLCGRASVTGDPVAFRAESATGATQITVKLPEPLRREVSETIEALGGDILGTSVGNLTDDTAPAPLRQAAATVGGLLGSLAPGVSLEQMAPQQTVGALLDRLAATDLARIDLGTATTSAGGDATSAVSEALNQGGRVDILPGFLGLDAPPLMSIVVAESAAGIRVERATAEAVPVITQTVVRVESSILAAAGGLPVGKALEIRPGESFSVLCDGPLTPLCSEVSVSEPKRPAALPGGVTRAEASQVTVHLFKGLDGLAAGGGLGSVLAHPLVAQAVDDLGAPAGLLLGEANAVPGIRLVMAGATAEGSGARVLAEESPRPAQASGTVTPPAAPATTPTPSPSPTAAPVKALGATLPHTGPPVPAGAVPALLTGAIALLGASNLIRRPR